MSADILPIVTRESRSERCARTKSERRDIVSYADLVRLQGTSNPRVRVRDLAVYVTRGTLPLGGLTRQQIMAEPETARAVEAAYKLGRLSRTAARAVESLGILPSKHARNGTRRLREAADRTTLPQPLTRASAAKLYGRSETAAPRQKEAA